MNPFLLKADRCPGICTSPSKKGWENPDSCSKTAVPFQILILNSVTEAATEWLLPNPMRPFTAACALTSGYFYGNISSVFPVRHAAKEYFWKEPSMDRIAVLIPCYNESLTIGNVVKDIRQALPEAVVYVYDNNSTDGSDRIAMEAGATVRYEKKQGKGNVTRSMFREIDADCYLMLDGDDTYPAEYAGQLCDIVLKEHADMVVGDRLSSTYFTENKRIFHNTGNRIVRNIINSLFHSDIMDIMTGYRAFSYEFAKTFPVLSKGFEIETEMTIHALDKDLKIANIIIEYKDRQKGSESKLNTYSDGIKVLLTIFNLYKNYRPLAFFSILAFMLLLISAAFLIPVVMDFYRTGNVSKLPGLVCCVFFALTAIQSFFAGLMLDTVTNKDRRDFEIKYTEFFQLHKRLTDTDSTRL